MNLSKACWFSLILILLQLGGLAQDSLPTLAADLARTGLLNDISYNTGYYFSDDRNPPIQQLPALPYRQNTRKFLHFVAPELVNKKLFLRFRLANRSDSPQNVFFCPGWLADTIQMYRLVGSRVEVLAREVPDDADSLGYRKITLAARDSAIFFAAVSYIKAPTNSVNPSLTRDTLIREGIVLTHKNKTSIDAITDLFAGVMLMMIFYAISEYMQSKKPEFLYYVGYSVCISVLLFLKATLNHVTTAFDFFFESFLDNIIFSAGYICYIIFHRKFLETSKNYRSLDRYLLWGSWGIAGLTFLYTLPILNVKPPFNGGHPLFHIIEPIPKLPQLLHIDPHPVILDLDDQPVPDSHIDLHHRTLRMLRHIVQRLLHR